MPPEAGPTGTIVLPPPPESSRGLPQAGEELGHYKIVRLLGSGGMGTVFEAEDLENGRRIALKVLSHTLDLPEARERFFREGRLAASINHPNSVYVFGTEEIGGTPIISMELVSGGTLQQQVRAQGPLPVGQAVDSVLQIIAGLQAAQRIGILHRDVKPSNCYRAEDGTVKIGDFGLSISTTVRTEPALTATGAFLGTPAFCSPEQLRGDELNARSDMYSVGATLFYLLTGRTPFEGKNHVQLLATVLEQPAPSPHQLRPDVPRALGQIVQRCLEKQPGDRFKSYDELARALTPFGSAAPTPATLGLRFLAGAIDAMILGVLSTAASWPLLGSSFGVLNLMAHRSLQGLAFLFSWFLGSIFYYATAESRWGATPGKAICRLRVVGPDKNQPDFWRAALRAFIYILAPVLPSWIYYGW
ncbi:MAG TPA: protein kinase, partial [Candidatus Dormibacteraeota bacterium]|nr:protein kinase [Candidatus Dormibacteraeota bacterium]